MGIYLIPIRYLVLILHTLKLFPMFLISQENSLRGEKVIWIKVEDHSFKNYVSLFISYSITSVVNLLQQSIFISHITTFITIFQTLLLFGTRIFKPVSFYCKSKFWQWIIKYSSVTCSFNLHYSFTTPPLPIHYPFWGIAVILRWYYGIIAVLMRCNIRAQYLRKSSVKQS